MRRVNVTRGGGKKLMHGIADPLTKLSLSLFLSITAGSIDTAASVRAGKRREEGLGISRVARGCAREAT